MQHDLCLKGKVDFPVYPVQGYSNPIKGAKSDYYILHGYDKNSPICKFFKVTIRIIHNYIEINQNKLLYTKKMNNSSIMLIYHKTCKNYNNYVQQPIT